MRILLQIVLFIFLAPLCCAFGVSGGCLVASWVKGPDFVMGTGIITGIVGGLFVAGLVVWSIRPGKV